MRRSRCGAFSVAKFGISLLFASALFPSLSPAAHAEPGNTYDWTLNVKDNAESTGGTMPKAGDYFSYDVVVTNEPTDGENRRSPETVISLSVPSTIQLVEVSGLTCGTALPAIGPQDVSCTIPELEAFGAVTFTVTMQANEEYTTARIINFLSEIPATNDPVPENNSHTEPTTIEAGPGPVEPPEPEVTDLSLEVTGPVSAPSTSSVSYVFTTENRGPDVASNWKLFVPEVNGLEFSSIPTGCARVSGGYECTFFGNIAASTAGDVNPPRYSVTFTGRVTEAGSSAGSEPLLEISGTVSAVNGTDPVAGNNSASTETRVSLGTDVSIAADAKPIGILGYPNSLVLTASYQGDAPETLELRSVIPEGYGVAPGGWTSVSGGWTCALNLREFVCTRPTTGLSSAPNSAALGSVRLELEVLDDPSAPSYRLKDAVPTTATISSTGPTELDLTNNTATISQDLQRPDVRWHLQKTISDNGRVLATDGIVVVSRGADGYDYTYEIQVRNDGNVAFDGELVVTDVIPSGVQFRGYSGTGWTCSPTASASAPLSSPSLTCSRDHSTSQLEPDATTAPLELVVRFEQEGSITNLATARAVDWPDGDGSGDVTVSSFEVPDAADISVNATALVNPVVTGSPQTIKMEVVNAGPNTSSDVVFSADFPYLLNNRSGGAGAGFQDLTVVPGSQTSGFSEGSCVNSSSGARGRQLTCTLTELRPCSAGVDCPIIRAVVLPGDGPASSPNSLTVTAFAQARDLPDLVTGNQEATATYTTIDRTDVELEITASTMEPIAGREYAYQVTVANPNTARYVNTADDVVVTQTLPAGVNFKRVAGAVCNTAPTADALIVAGSNDQLECNLATVSSGEAKSYSVYFETVRQASDLTLETSAQAVSSTEDLDLSNNEDSLTLMQKAEPALDLIVNSQDDVDPIDIGSEMNFDVTVRNAGPSFAEDVTVTYNMPSENLSFQRVSPGAAACSSEPTVGEVGGQLVCTFDRIDAGDTMSLQITALAGAKGPTSSSAILSSPAISDGADRLAGNNSENETTTVVTRVDGEVVSKIASPERVERGEPFTYDITVRFADEAQFQEADDVVVKDSLPNKMYLVGGAAAEPTVSVIQGSTTLSTCSVASNERSFECTLGTVEKGSEFKISVPVYIDNVTSFPRSIKNTATLDTTSRDVNENNNAREGAVRVVGSTIEGMVFMDFDENDLNDNNDIGARDIEIALTGTDRNGDPVNRTTTTNSAGEYSFSNVLSGTYSLTREDVSGSKFLLDSKAFVGDIVAGTDALPIPARNPSDDGVVAGAREITGIIVAKETVGSNYDFSVIPQARVGIALDEYSTTYPEVAADGSFTTRLVMRVENFSEEPVQNAQIILPLNGAEPRFGSFVSLSNPANDNLDPGSYAITVAPRDRSGSVGGCGGYNSGYNGQSDPVVVTGATIGAAATCDVEVHVRVQPLRPGTPAYPGTYRLQAEVKAQGNYSGQVDTSYNLLDDLSHHGSNPDPDNDNNPTEVSEQDLTPVLPSYRSRLSLIMQATPSWNTSTEVAEVGDTITYSYEVYSRNGASANNKSNIELRNVIVTNDKTGLVLTGAPLTTLDTGNAGTNSGYLGVYTLTQADIEAGEVTNSARVSASDVFGFALNDVSGTAVDNDTPLTTPLTQQPSVALVVVPDESALKTPTEVGDKIAYSYNIKNTGNVILKDVLVTDIRSNVEGLSSTAIAEMQPGQEVVGAFTASYPVTQADIDVFQVTNTAKVQAKAVSASNVSDLVGTTYDNDGPVVTPLSIKPDIDLVLSADTSGLSQSMGQAGENLVYHYEVTNKGSVTLSNVNITNTLTGVVMTGSPITLAPDETSTGHFSGDYLLTAGDVTAQVVANSATTTGYYDRGTKSVSDTENLTTSIVFIEAKSEAPWTFTEDGGTTTSVLASDRIGADPATLTNATLSVVSTDPELSLDTSTGFITLSAGNPAGQYQLTYRLCRRDAPSVCADATETVVQAPIDEIETTVVLELSDNGDGIDGVGDLATYTISVENKGNTDLFDLDLNGTFQTLENEVPLVLDSGPIYLDRTSGVVKRASLEPFKVAMLGTGDLANLVLAQATPPDAYDGTLKLGETVRFTSTFTITVPTVVNRGASYQVLATATPIYPSGAGTPAGVSDISDDGLDADGNVVDDPTLLELAPMVQESALQISKTTTSTVVTRGATVPYTLKISNRLSTSAGPLDLVDVLPSDFVYIEGSARVEGASFTPKVEGRLVTFQDLEVLPNGTLTATLRARVLVTADVGEHTNKARLRDAGSGEMLAREAEATVSILPEHVFDCGDVYGKVFDDRNRDGYQNPPDGTRVEPGIPSVRLTGVDGTIITTDKHGRFHVACAMLPKDRGSNFILKLDARSLPEGYRVTTENPRVVRLTPGKMTELNFGAARATVSRIGLNRDGFVGTELSPALKKALLGLGGNLGYGPVHFELTYHLKNYEGADETSVALRRMEALEGFLRGLWSEHSKDTPSFEVIISRTKD
ncbi:DUF7507 domain-containing protein [Pseudovibrio exalbescens]|uniref:DUF7507 domain-containing protein n=1 Tax=Pseudovibrio exalbescens TaxID=197461 RepID=UPI000C9B177F|nr:SdrD B-like domain-containing protein [Pseudovibrio exalbescens]